MTLRQAWNAYRRNEYAYYGSQSWNVSDVLCLMAVALAVLYFVGRSL
jgi:hypothetical protein